MDISPVGLCLYVALVMVQCVQVQSELSCDQTKFLNPNGTCVECPVCGAGEQLSEDCGFGDDGGGACVPCDKGKFSSNTDVAPCRRCTKCSLLSRLENTACSPSSDALCGHCLQRYYELRSVTGEVEPSCVPCHSHDTVHKECLLSTAQSSKAGEKEEDISVILIGSATASSVFLIALLLWAFLLTAKRFKQIPEFCPGPEGLLSAADLQGLTSLNHGNEAHPTSIVINVTTNIKPSSQKTENITQEEQKSSCFSTEEMEQKLQTIWEKAQGDSVETLDYDSVQDLSLLLDSADDRKALRGLGRSLGVPPQVVVHLQGFQDLFQYLRTSTSTLLPQLAQAAALLPNPEVVARIHRAVVNK